MKNCLFIGLIVLLALTGCDKNEQYKLTYNVYMGQNAEVDITYRKANTNFDLEESSGNTTLVWTKSVMVNKGFKAYLEARIKNPQDSFTDVVIEIVENEDIIKRRSTSETSELRVTIGENKD